MQNTMMTRMKLTGMPGKVTLPEASVILPMEPPPSHIRESTPVLVKPMDLEPVMTRLCVAKTSKLCRQFPPTAKNTQTVTRIVQVRCTRLHKKAGSSILRWVRMEAAHA